MKLQLALEELISLVDAGAELPDVMFSVTQKYKVSAEALLEAYDNEFV